MRGARGQATIEWTAVLLVVSLGLGAAGAAAGQADGRSFGGFLAHRIVCAVKRGCDDGERELARAYGRRAAELVRHHAPGIVYEPGERALPVDWRSCRERQCSNGPDDRDLDVHRSDRGKPVTAFVRLLPGRRQGRTYIQYWLYYPDSNTGWAGSDRLWSRSALLPLVGKALRGSYGYPGHQLDDWEGYQVRVDRDGRAWVRATSHGHYQGCKQRLCRNRWMPATGWTRVSRGSHAGHIPVTLSAPVGWGPWPKRRRILAPRYPGRDVRERTTTGEGLRLVPLEVLDHHRYQPLDSGVKPPWRKEVYRRPESDSS